MSYSKTHLLGALLVSLIASSCRYSTDTSTPVPNDEREPAETLSHGLPDSDKPVSPMLPDPPSPTPPSEPDPDQGVIYGRVIHPTTGQGISGVQVALTGSALTSTTDINGQYTFNTLTPGDYEVHIAPQLATCFQATTSHTAATANHQTQHDIPIGQSDGLTIKVLGIHFNPLVDGQPLHKYLNWLSPRQLTETFIQDVGLCSGGLIRYSIVEWIDVNAIPVKADGFQYTTDAYLQMLKTDSTHHEPDWANYSNIINDFDLTQKINSGAIDEVFMWGGPWFGFYESVMVGQGSYWINGSIPSSDYEGTHRRAVIMGFNYGYIQIDTAIAMAMHSLGHRAESIMAHTFGSWNKTTPQHAWDSFTSYQHVSPGNTGCGTIHFPPNIAGTNAYDYNSTFTVKNNCHTFADWPSSSQEQLDISAAVWNYSQRGYLRWWYGHLPRQEGTYNSKIRNWWQYLFDINECFENTYANDTVAAACETFGL